MSSDKHCKKNTVNISEVLLLLLLRCRWLFCNVSVQIHLDFFFLLWIFKFSLRFSVTSALLISSLTPGRWKLFMNGGEDSPRVRQLHRALDQNRCDYLFSDCFVYLQYEAWSVTYIRNTSRSQSGDILLHTSLPRWTFWHFYLGFTNPEINLVAVQTTPD